MARINHFQCGILTGFSVDNGGPIVASDFHFSSVHANVVGTKFPGPYLLQSPIGHEPFGFGEASDAKCDRVDTGDAHKRLLNRAGGI